MLALENEGRETLSLSTLGGFCNTLSMEKKNAIIRDETPQNVLAFLPRVELSNTPNPKHIKTTT